MGVLMATNASHSIWGWKGRGGDVCTYSRDSGETKTSVCVYVCCVCVRVCVCACVCVYVCEGVVKTLDHQSKDHMFKSH